MIPEPHFGKEPTLKEVVEGNKEKGYKPHPELLQSKYAGFYRAAQQLEGMVSDFGIHPAGVVISDFPIWDLIPLWSKEDQELKEDGKKKKIRKWITQFDMKEVEEFGLIKFDNLSLDNLSYVKECIRLIKENHDVDIDFYNVTDGDKAAYKLFASGLLTGVFQFETSGSIKDMAVKAQPQSIEELSDLTSLHRPGPMQAGLVDKYLEAKIDNIIDTSMPKAVQEVLGKTYNILIYQEQLMALCMKLANFTELEADQIRRAMGKKQLEVLKPYETQFVEGCIRNGISKVYASDLWDMFLGYADYCFNSAHAVVE